MRASFIPAALGLCFVQCAGDQKAPVEESPMPPPAEPPAEMTAARPAASVASEPSARPAAGEVTKSKGLDASKAEEAKASKAEEAKATPLSDAQIAAITDLANTAEIEQAKLARAKSKNPEVLKFAAMMIAHHGEAKQKQAKLKLTTADSAIATQLLEDGNQVLAALKDSKGAEFDRRYLEAQVDGHQKVLDTLDHELLPSVKNPEIKAYLEELKPKVLQHLQAARDAQKAVESSSGARGSSGTSMK